MQFLDNICVHFVCYFWSVILHIPHIYALRFSDLFSLFIYLFYGVVIVYVVACFFALGSLILLSTNVGVGLIFHLEHCSMQREKWKKEVFFFLIPLVEQVCRNHQYNIVYHWDFSLFRYPSFCKGHWQVFEIKAVHEFDPGVFYKLSIGRFSIVWKEAQRGPYNLHCI